MALTVEQLDNALDVSRVYMACVYSILIWDYLITFPAEYRFIWKGKWSPAKVLFLINRYYSLFQMSMLMVLWWAPLPRETCTKLMYFEPYSTSVVLALCHAIFYLRTSAIWGWRWSVQIPLLTVIAGEVAAEFVTGSHNILIPGQTKGCISGSGVNYIWLYWGFPLVYDALTLTLTFIGVYRLQKQTQGANMTPLMKQLLQDGVLYFLVVFAVNLLNEIFFLLHNPAIQALHAGLAIVMTTVMASRLVLKMRESGNDRSPQSTAVPRSSYWTGRHTGTASVGDKNSFPLGTTPRSPPLGAAAYAGQVRLETVVRQDYDVEKTDSDVGFEAEERVDTPGTPTNLMSRLEKSTQPRIYHSYGPNAGDHI